MAWSQQHWHGVNSTGMESTAPAWPSLFRTVALIGLGIHKAPRNGDSSDSMDRSQCTKGKALQNAAVHA